MTELISLMPEVFSLDIPTGEGDDGSLHSLLEDIQAPQPYEELVRRELENTIKQLLSMLPDAYRAEFSALFAEMAALRTPEAKLFKALDNMEALVSHNEADISTWLPLEYTENLVYGAENCAWSDWTRALREELRRDSVQKIERES